MACKEWQLISLKKCALNREIKCLNYSRAKTFKREGKLIEKVLRMFYEI